LREIGEGAFFFFFLEKQTPNKVYLYRIENNYWTDYFWFRSFFDVLLPERSVLYIKSELSINHRKDE